MSTNTKSQLSAIFTLAWQFVKKNGFTLSEALKVAWANFKLKIKMQAGIVKFHYYKVNGEIREAYGTLKAELLPPVGGHRQMTGCQVYFDTEKGEWRCFKQANLIG